MPIPYETLGKGSLVLLLPAFSTVSTRAAVKAMILNGLGLTSAPMYLFEQFFVGKATEHLLGEGVLAEYLDDERLGRVLDLFIAICLVVAQKFGVERKSAHLDVT